MFELFEKATVHHEKILPLGRTYYELLHDLEEVKEELLKDKPKQVEEPDILPKNYKKLDAKDWRKLDLYLVLGLKSRFNATEDEIKQTYKKRVLKYHPDKNNNEDAFFKCIQKANEILSDPVKRRQFDSVDPTFDDSVPEKLQGDFFEQFGPIFEANARFSKVKPVPALGKLEDSKLQVETFYNFWYNFDSWRSFEFLDEEEVEGDNRENKRYIEKKNKAARVKHKNEDNSRITRLVDMAMKLDPRIKRIKEEEKAAKELKKNSKTTSVQQQKIDRLEKEKADKLAKEKADQEARQQALALKKIREANELALKKERSEINKKLEQVSYFGKMSDMNNIEAQLIKLEKIFSNFNLEEISSFKQRLVSSLDESQVKQVFDEQFSSIGSPKSQVSALENKENKETTQSASIIEPWTKDQVSLLIKAVNSHPGGTVDRWQVIKNFLEQHQVIKSVQDIIDKAHNLKPEDLKQ